MSRFGRGFIGRQTLRGRPGSWEDAPTGTTVHSDSQTGTLILSGSLAESRTGANTPTGSLILGGTLTDAITFATSPHGTITLAGTLTDSITFTVSPDLLNQTGVGSTDWAGGHAPAGGAHTGQTTLTMKDGSQYVVAHSVAESLGKINSAVGLYFPPWSAFDLPLVATPIVVNCSEIAVVGNRRIA